MRRTVRLVSGQTELAQETEVRGCGLLRPHDAHEHSTATRHFHCPGVELAPPSQRRAAEQLVATRNATHRRSQH
jgi:hypothetical protein